MNCNKNREEAKQWFAAARDDLDSGAILMMHKKHKHACFFARQAAIKALKALWFLHNTEPAKRGIPGLFRGLKKIANPIFLNLEILTGDLRIIDRWPSPDSPTAKEFGEKECELFINTAYKIVAEVDTIIFASGAPTT